MDAGVINIALNLLGVLLGGGALVGVLRYLNNRQSIRNADEADIRDHYAEELERQTAAVAAAHERHNAALEASDRRLVECESWASKSRLEIRALNQKVDDQQDEITGLKRQIARYSAEGAIMLADQVPSEEVENSAHRVINEIDKKEGK